MKLHWCPINHLFQQPFLGALILVLYPSHLHSAFCSRLTIKGKKITNLLFISLPYFLLLLKK